VDGVDYHFVSEERFLELIADGALVEWAHVHGHHYGTPLASIENATSLAVFDIDVQGGESIKRRYPEAVRALVLPPSLAELERRLRARSTDDDGTIRRRMHAARIELRLAFSAGYEYWVVNDDLEKAYLDLEAIVRAEGCKAGKRALAPDLGTPSKHT
jgi:guanylate kinase